MTNMTLALQRNRWTLRLQYYINIRNRRGEKDDFSYSNVLEDLILKVLLDSSITLDVLEDKLHALVQTYVAEKENAKKTSTPICVAPMHSSLEYMFWDNPLIYNIHTLNIGRYHIKANPNQQEVVNSSDANIYAATLSGVTNRKRKFLDEVSGDMLLRLEAEKRDVKAYLQEVRCKKLVIEDATKRMREKTGHLIKNSK